MLIFVTFLKAFHRRVPTHKRTKIKPKRSKQYSSNFLGSKGNVLVEHSRNGNESGSVFGVNIKSCSPSASGKRRGVAFLTLLSKETLLAGRRV